MSPAVFFALSLAEAAATQLGGLPLPSDLWGYLQTSALVTVTVLLIIGVLLPRWTVENHIVKPLQSQIDDLRAAKADTDREYRDLVKQQAAALEIQSRLVESLVADLKKARG